MRAALVALTLVALAGTAIARPPPPPDDPPPPPRGPLVEWTSWLRVAYGSAPAETAARPRVVGPTGLPDPGREHGWEVALGADATIAVARDVRVGPWVELRTSSDPMIGGELVVTRVPETLDMFWYKGRGVLAVRAGGNRELATAAISYGYQAPWDLMRPRHGRTRYMIGLRAVVTATRAVDDPRIWSTTLGLEVEPVGALRYLLGIRGWY